jgi:hypothetical protein
LRAGRPGFNAEESRENDVVTGIRRLALRFAVATTVVLAGCTTGTTGASSVGDTLDTTTLVVTTAGTPVTAPEATTTLLPGADPVLGIVPPEPTDYPFVEYSYRWTEYVAQCSAAAGFEFKLIGGAAPQLSFVGTVTPRREEVLTRCQEITHERGWVIPNPFDGSSEANGILYDIWVDIHDCMVDNGYPTTDPPSRDAFIEEGQTLWTPWEKMYNSVLYVDPESDWGPSGTMPPGDRLQYEAQQACGGVANEIYDQQLQEQG